MLFGLAQPTGKLPMSWMSSASQQPINDGDGKVPLFPFGFGLGYTARDAYAMIQSERNSIVIVVITTGAALAALLFSEAARGEVFKLFVVVYFSLLPAFLYLQFMSIRGRTLWEEYIENLFRLQADEDASLPKPPPHSRFYRHWKAVSPIETLMLLGYGIEKQFLPRLAALPDRGLSRMAEVTREVWTHFERLRDGLYAT